MKKLKIDEDFKYQFNVFMNHIRILDHKLECILWQLPGNFKRQDDKIKNFANLLKINGMKIQHVIEFRHNSWFNQDIYTLLRDSGISFSMVSAPGQIPEDVVATTTVGYLRMHGKTDWYNYSYSKEELTKWKHKIERLLVEKIFIYFNNDLNANAVSNANTFKMLMK